MAYNDILEELRSHMGDDAEANEKFLKEAGERYAHESNYDAVKAVGELLMENMPEERRNEIIRLTHIDGVRMDEIYNQVNQLISQKKLIEAKSLAEKLYKKVTVDFAETDKVKFVSLRNPFEDNLCQLLFPSEKTLNRTPFDFCAYLATYAFILVETGSTIDALPILEKAIEYNPVDVGPLFEMAEIFKLIKNKKRMIEVTQQTLKVASSPLAIARCYANMGYMLTDFAEYEDAVVFYTASAMMAPNPAIPREIQHVADLKGTPVKVPPQETVVETMKKYGMEFGPDKNVISVAAQLSMHFLSENDIPNALQALKMTFNLTQDESVKKLILKYDPKAATMKPYAESEKPDIKQTVNDNPEE